MGEKDTIDKANAFVNKREKEYLAGLEANARAEFTHAEGCGCNSCRILAERAVYKFVIEKNRMTKVNPKEES